MTRNRATSTPVYMQFLASRSAPMALSKALASLLTLPREILCHQGCDMHVAHGCLQWKTRQVVQNSHLETCIFGRHAISFALRIPTINGFLERKWSPSHRN